MGQPGPSLAHANGFPAGTYRRVFEAWRAAGLAVLAPEKFGHDERYPVTSNWPHLRDQLISFVEREGRRPVCLVGHSMGGYLSVLAAAPGARNWCAASCWSTLRCSAASPAR